MNKLHKIISLVLCLLLLAGLAGIAYAQEDAEVVQISSLEAFLEFAENCRLDSYSTEKSFLLTVDIDLTGTDFDGIPIFCGTFDGGYHTISGLDIHSAGSAKGLFRHLEASATVKNLNVNGSVIPTGSRCQVGGIAGTNAGIIENCTFSGTVTGAEYAGGIAGLNEAGGLIAGCSAEGTVSAYHFSGGITGSNEGTVRDCTNYAGVNVTAQQNDIDISDINLGTLTNTESATATTDIGGIAGYSSGIIRGCVNRGSVGYKHMGYNVGGIAGLQAGYVADCENYGAISGRKEVGGIVGQQEPQVVLRYQTDTIQILQSQFAVLSDLIDRASANGSSNTSTIRNLIYKLENYVADAEAALDVLKAGLEKPRLEDLQTYADAIQTIRDSIAGIDTTVRALWAALNETMTDLDRDMKAITEQLAVIEGTLNNAEDNLGGQVFDISDQDTPEDLISKVENCRNYASILADLHAGGIVGAVVFENDLDPEEDISIVGDTTLNAVGSLRSVILNCQNYGSVTAKNQRIGGIAGWLSMGLIKNCVNTGAIDNETANYVGGIAGDASGYIRNCQVKSVIRGAACVGGIAGSGTIATECFAMVQLSGTERVGCIFGVSEEPYSDIQDPITDNYYLQFGKDYGAIDGISYSEKAQGLGMEEFFALTQNPLFDQVTLTFIADGEVVIQVTQNAGSSFDTVPDVPQKDGYAAYWEGLADADLECVLFDLNIQAQYVAYTSTIQSEQADAQGKPILLLQGDFSIGATAAVTQLQNFTALRQEQTLLQGWEIDVQQCIDLYGGRLLIPTDTDMTHVILMVRDCNGNWAERVFTTDGSYIVFSLARGDDSIALVQVPQDTVFTPEVLIAASAGAAAVLLIVVLCIAVRSRKRKTAEVPEEAPQLLTE